MAPDALPDGRHEKLSKAESGYLERCPDNRSPCMICLGWDPHLRSCSKVTGTIAAMGTCNHFGGVVRAPLPAPADDDRKVPLWGSKAW